MRAPYQNFLEGWSAVYGGGIRRTKTKWLLCFCTGAACGKAATFVKESCVGYPVKVSLQRLSCLPLRADQVGDVQSVCRRLGERPGKARAVPDGIDILAAADLEIFGLRPGRIVLALDAVQQGVIVGGAGRDRIQRVQRLDDVVQLALWHAQAQVAGHSAQSWPGGGVCHYGGAYLP